MFKLLLTTALLATSHVTGFSSGAGSCYQPGTGAHGMSDGELSNGGYSLLLGGAPMTTTPTTVTSGQVMPLTLTRSSGSFKGYLITAEGAVLTISSSDGKSKSCSGKGAITHSSSGGQGTVTAML